MKRRDLVKAAIAHKVTERVPYAIPIGTEGEKHLQAVVGKHSALEVTDNDIVEIEEVPWWTWRDLGPEWRQMDPPSVTAGVQGTGSYDDFFRLIKTLREQSDKYLLISICASHYEKAGILARGCENFLADMVGDPPFARKFLNRIIEKNMVMGASLRHTRRGQARGPQGAGLNVTKWRLYFRPIAGHPGRCAR